MSLSREERHKRNEIYDYIFEMHLPQLAKLYDAMLISEESIKAEIEETRRVQQKRDRWAKGGYLGAKGGYLVGILGTILTIVSLILAFMH